MCRLDVFDNRQDKETKSISSLLEKVIATSVELEAFPKSVVELYIMVFEVDGDPLCLSLMCASLALTNAGLNLYGLLGCCCVVQLIDPGYVQSVMKDNSMIVHPTTEELNKSKCYTTLAVLNSTKVDVIHGIDVQEVIYISHCGAVSPDICAMVCIEARYLEQCISKCMEEASRLCGCMRDYLLREDAQWFIFSSVCFHIPAISYSL